MPAGDASLTTAQVKKNPLTAITVSIDSDHGIYRDPANPGVDHLIGFT
jgi:hypothetical protein